MHITKTIEILLISIFFNVLLFIMVPTEIYDKIQGLLRDFTFLFFQGFSKTGQNLQIYIFKNQNDRHKLSWLMLYLVVLN